MPLVINTNTAATLATANLASANTQLTRSLNRLSSGSKIQQPADDAGGLAVSMKISAAARRMGAASTNISNSVSFLQTQDGALKVAGKILDRVSELKTFAVDSTKNASDIANYNQEFLALQKELKAVAAETFNGKSLFSTSDADVATTEDGTKSVTMKGIDLLGVDPSRLETWNAGGIGGAFPTDPLQIHVLSGTMTFSFTSGSLALTGSDTLSFDGGTTYTRTSDGATATSNNGFGMNADTTTKLYWEMAGDSPTGNVGNVASAEDLSSLAIGTVTSALQEIATHRAANGGYQSQLMMASELLATNKANMEQANSRIVDVDVAEESGALARANVLVQAGTAMLSQAKDSSQMALRLIG